MENDPGGEAASRTDTAHAMAHIHSVETVPTKPGPGIYREDCSIAFMQRNDLRSRLHARALLGENEFTAGEIRPGFG